MFRAVQRTACLALLSALPLAAQDGGEPSASELTYRAFYEEAALGRYEGALAGYRQAVQLEPQGAHATEAHLGMARCLIALGRPAEAGSALEAALRLDPANPEIAALRAELQRSEGGDEDSELAVQMRGMVQEGRAHELVELGAAAIPALAEGMRSRDIQIARGATDALMNLRAQHRELIASVVPEALADPEVVLREQLARSVANSTLPVIGPYEDYEEAYWGALFTSTSVEARRIAVRRLTQMLDNHFEVQTAPSLARALAHLRADPDTEVRRLLFFDAYESLFANAWAADPELTAVLRPMVTASLTAVNMEERTVAWQLAAKHSVLFEELRERLLDPVELSQSPGAAYALAARMSDRASELEIPLEEGLRAALAIVGDDNLRTRMNAWRWVSDHLRAGSITEPPAMRAAAFEFAKAVIERYGVMTFSPNFRELFSGWSLSSTEWAELWVWARKHDSHAAGGLCHERLVSLLQEPGRGAEIAVEVARLQVASKQALGWDWELARVVGEQLVPDAYEGLVTLCGTEQAEERDDFYRLVRIHADSAGRVLQASEFPFLEQDLVGTRSEDHRSTRTEARKLALALADPALLERYRVRVQGDSIGRRAAYLAFELLSGSVEEDTASSLAAIQSLGEPQLARREFLRAIADLVSARHPVWDALADQIDAHPGLDLLLLIYSEPEQWEFELAQRVARSVLDEPDSHPNALRTALQLAARRDLAIPLADLAPFLRHYDNDVRNEAQEAVERARVHVALAAEASGFGLEERTRAANLAREAARSESWMERKGAALAIGALGDPGGTAILLELLSDEAADVRIAALNALEKLGGEE